jgi:VWFA-related protein
MNTLRWVMAGALIASGQQPKAPVPNSDSGNAVFSVTSTLVQVDAVVTDGKGRNIDDLTPEEFEVSVDGKPEKLTHFSYVRVMPEGSGAPVKPVQKAVSALPPAPSAQLRPEDVRRTIVLMVDDLGLSFESMAFVRSSLRKFIENQLQPGDLVAILRTGAGSGALQQFTVDKRVLLSVADGLRWNPNGRSGIDVFEQLGKVSDLAGKLDDAIPSGQARSIDPQYNVQNKTVSMVGTLGAINYIVGALREMPGRKSIVLFSDGFQLFTPGVGPAMHTSAGPGASADDNTLVIEAMRRLIDRANRSGTVIYTMQATGLQTGQIGGADRLGLNQLSPAQVQATLGTVVNDGAIGGRDWLQNVNQQGLAYLALQTGGLAYDNGNDLNWALDRVLEDQKGYYLLGFYPPEGTFQDKHNTRSFHGIKVRVKRAGLHVRSRSGYFGETDEETRLQKPKTLVAQMRAAMLSPFKSSDIHVKLTALYANTAKGPVVRNLLYVDGRDVTWRSAGDSSKAQLQVLAVANGDSDANIQTVAREYESLVQSAKLDDAKREGVVYTIDIPAPKRGGYQIRVAVRDAATEKVGSATQFVEVPDLKSARFVLTGVVLQDGSGAARRSVVGMAPARRQFRPGAEVEYLSALQKGRGAEALADLAAQIRIVRDGKDVYSAPAKVVEIPGSGSAVFGVLKLNKEMVPGEYFLQVAARDAKGGKNGLASQWTDFEILP